MKAATVWSAARLRRQAHFALEGGEGRSSSIIVQRFLVAVILISVTGVVLSSVPALRADYRSLFTSIEVVALVIFTLEYGLRLWVATEDIRVAGKSPMAARFAYARSPMAIIDLLAIAPIYVEEVLPEDFRILLTLRLLRFIKLARYSPGMRSLIAAVEAERKALMASFVILMGFLVLSASAMYMVERSVQPDKFGTIPDAMWWAIVTLATVGYGDVVPLTPMGRVVAGFTMVAGMMMLALPIGIIATSFAQEIHRRDFVVTWEMVARVPLFASLEASEIADIMRYLRAQTVPAGAVITRRGDVAYSMYFIATGEVEIDLPQQNVRLGDGHFFGEIAALHQTRRSATVRATRPTRLLVLDAHDLHLVMAQKPDVAQRIHDVVRERTDVANARSDILPDEISDAT